MSIVSREKVAVVIPWGGNKRDQLSISMQSIDSQTYAKVHKILVTDGFTIQQNFRLRFPDWIFLHNETSVRGPAATRNIAIKSLPDDVGYILLADADDVSHPRRIEILLHEMKKKDLDVVGSQGVILHESLIFRRTVIYPYPCMSGNKRRIGRKLASGKNAFLAASVLLRREVFEELDGYDENLLRGEDLEFFQRAAQLGFEMDNTRHTLYGYRTDFWTPYSKFKDDWIWSGRNTNLQIAYFGHLLRRLITRARVLNLLRKRRLWKSLTGH